MSSSSKRVSPIRGNVSDGSKKWKSEQFDDVPDWSRVEYERGEVNNLSVFIEVVENMIREGRVRVPDAVKKSMELMPRTSFDFEPLDLMEDASLNTLDKVWARTLSKIENDEALEALVFTANETSRASEYVPSRDAQKVIASYVSDKDGDIVPLFIEERKGSDGEPEYVQVKYNWSAEEFQEQIKRLREKNNIQVQMSKFEDAFQLYFDRKKKTSARFSEFSSLQLPSSHVGKNTYLSKHQIDALNFIFGQCLGRCIVSLAPGMGKTLIGCVFAKSYINSMTWKRNIDVKALYVCPASVVLNWIREAKEKLDVKLDKNDVMSYEQLLKKCNVKISAQSSEEEIRAAQEKVRTWMRTHHYKIGVFDECHRLKSANSIRSKVLIPALSTELEYVLLLSGTPMPNRPNEIYNLLRMVDPATFPESRRRAFEEAYCGGFSETENKEEDEIDAVMFNNRGSSSENELSALTSIYMYKNEKSSDIETELVRTHIKCTPAIDDLTNYSAQSFVSAEKSDTAYLVKAMNEYRDLLTKFMVAKEVAAKKIAKLKLDKHILQQYYLSGYYKTMLIIRDFLHNPQSVFRAKAGDRCVFFVHHIKFAEMLYESFPQGQACMITGSTPKRQRAEIVKSFAANESSPFKYGVFTTNAMSEGVNLVPFVNKLFIVEMEFRPSSSIQAEKRIHRKGATLGKVHTYWLTIDMRDATMEFFVKKQKDEIEKIAQRIQKEKADVRSTNDLKKNSEKELQIKQKELERMQGHVAYSMDEWILNNINSKLETNYRIVGGSIPKKIEFNGGEQTISFGESEEEEAENGILYAEFDRWQKDIGKEKKKTEDEWKDEEEADEVEWIQEEDSKQEADE
jgi:superfamily II DNA or RNA helicase